LSKPASLASSSSVESSRDAAADSAKQTDCIPSGPHAISRMPGYSRSPSVAPSPSTTHVRCAIAHPRQRKQ
jgi:hypothetical protein